MKPQESLIALAQHCREQKAVVLPYWYRDKVPSFDPEHPFPQDDAFFETWFHPDKNPHHNIGLVTGTCSNLVVLDVDVYRGGARDLAELQALFGPLPETLTSLTSQGGFHLYFSLPTPTAIIPAKGGHNGGWLWGIDLLGENGRALIPPSVHPNGIHYRWKAFKGKPIHHFERDLVQPCPEWLYSPEVNAQSWRRLQNPISGYWVW